MPRRIKNLKHCVVKESQCILPANMRRLSNFPLPKNVRRRGSVPFTKARIVGWKREYSAQSSDSHDMLCHALQIINFLPSWERVCNSIHGIPFI